MSIKEHSVVKNSVWLLAESVFVMLISLIIGIISARYLGPSNYGIVNRFLPYISLANSICTFGMQSIIIREISKNESVLNISEIMGSTIIFRLAISIIAAVCICSYGFYVSKIENSPDLFIICVFESIALVFNLNEIIAFYFHAVLKSKYLALTSVITSILIGAWKIFLLSSKADVVWFGLSSSFQAMITLLFLYIFFKNDFKIPLRFSYIKLKSILQRSIHLLITSLGIAIYGQVDKMMIGSMLGNEELGYYTSAFTLATIWYFIPQALSNSMRSKIFNESSNEELYTKDIKILYLITAIIGAAAGLVYLSIGKYLILLMFGEQYLAATGCLMILGWVGLFANIGTAKSIWLVGKKLEKYTKYLTLFGAAMNLLLNALLIPAWGCIGAAIATVISQMSVQIVFPLLFKETRPLVFQMFTCYTVFPELRKFSKGILESIKSKMHFVKR